MQNSNEAAQAIVHPIQMDDANKIIELHSGGLDLRRTDFTIAIEGSVSYRWFPRPSAILKARFTQQKPTYDVGDLSLYVRGEKFGDCVIKRLAMDGQGNITLTAGFADSPGLGDRSIPVSSVRFAIANLKPIGGNKWIKYPSGKSSSARTSIENDKYIIHLEPVSNVKEAIESLDDLGGYRITYTGELLKKNSSLTHEESDKVLHCLSSFLSFVNGRRCSALFREGVFEGKVIWQDYGSYLTDPYGKSFSFKPILSEQLLRQSWSVFSKLWQDDDDRDFLTSMTHWYLEANGHSAFTEGSIIMTQTALELAYNWLLIEKQKLIIGQDAENISAANKLRLLLSHIRVPVSFPPKLERLRELQSREICDCPEAITYIRNAIIHSQEQKRKKLRTIHRYAKAQALWAAIWYIELVMLKVLEYDGKYRNRVSADPSIEETVPWSIETVK